MLRGQRSAIPGVYLDWAVALQIPRDKIERGTLLGLDWTILREHLSKNMRLFRRTPSLRDAQEAEDSFLRLRSEVASTRRTVLFDPDLGLYQRWYFEFRLKEEVARATRFGTPFALLLANPSRPTGNCSSVVPPTRFHQSLVP